MTYFVQRYCKIIFLQLNFAHVISFLQHIFQNLQTLHFKVHIRQKLIQSFQIYNRMVARIFPPQKKKIAKKLILSILISLLQEFLYYSLLQHFFYLFFDQECLIFFQGCIQRGYFSWTGVLNKGVLCHFTIYKISLSFLSFSPEWTKQEILPSGGKFCFNSFENIFFQVVLSPSKKIVLFASLKALQK